MGFPVWRTKEGAEKAVEHSNKRAEERDMGQRFHVIKVEVVNPELLVKNYGGYWVDKNIGDPTQDPFGVGEANQEVFHVGDIGYLKLVDGDPWDCAEVGLKKV